MSEERWARLRELFHHAVDLSPADRDAFLKEACTDASIRYELKSLLASADGDFLISPVVEGVRKAIEFVEAAIDDDGDGTRSTPLVSGAAGILIGRYHLLESIGEGGMGEVWLAEQSDPICRQVALKVVKAGKNTREVIARFESERQALALMDHPAIAKVFDAGSTPQGAPYFGAPYFVMEYVVGAPITDYCDNNRLTIRERLELFMHVCEGVQHAHQKETIHRDLKPSNILVTEVDGKPAPKIIDFGIAKALGQRLTADALLTRVGEMVGTPAYMSPEQANSSGKDIDTRTDVYSLGILLYELLTGGRPIAPKASTSEEFLRMLREEEPQKPSTKILRRLREEKPQKSSGRIPTQDEDTVSKVALKRQVTPKALARQMYGDLDSIVLKALEKDRSCRYGSPSEFTADIERYLRNERVLAGTPSPAYRARKFARRNSKALIIAAAIVLVLIAATAISIRQSIRANREAAAAQAVNDFLQNDLLAQASANTQARPNVKPDPHLEVRTALDRAAVRIPGKFNRQPEVEAVIRHTIGQTYIELGLYPEAQAQFGRALELDRQILGEKNPKTLKIMSRLGHTAYLLGKYPRAESLLSQAAEVQRRVLGPDHPDTLRSVSSLAVVYFFQGKYAQAEKLDLQTWEARRRVLGPEHPDTLTSATNLANVYYQQAKYPQAAEINKQTLAIRRRVFGPEHPDTMASMNALATVYFFQGEYASAEALFLQILAVQRRVLGRDHHDTLMSMMNLGNVYREQGKYPQAEALLNESLEIRQRLLGAENPETLTSMLNLANVYFQEGKYAEAEAFYNQTLEIRSRVLGSEHPSTLISMANLASVYGLQEKYAQAEALFSRTVEIAGRKLGKENRYTLIFLSDFGSMYQRQGKYALAETYAAQTLVGLRHILGTENTNTMEAAADLALAFQSQGKSAESEPLAREALEFNQKKQPDNWQRFRAESLLGASLAGQRKYSEAEPLLLEGHQGMVTRKERIPASDWHHLDRAGEWIVQLYLASGQPQKAAEWKRKK